MWGEVWCRLQLVLLVGLGNAFSADAICICVGCFVVLASTFASCTAETLLALLCAGLFAGPFGDYPSYPPWRGTTSAAELFYLHHSRSCAAYASSCQQTGGGTNCAMKVVDVSVLVFCVGGARTAARWSATGFLHGLLGSLCLDGGRQHGIAKTTIWAAAMSRPLLLKSLLHLISAALWQSSVPWQVGASMVICGLLACGWHCRQWWTCRCTTALLMAFLCCASWRDHCFGFCIGKPLRHGHCGKESVASRLRLRSRC